MVQTLNLRFLPVARRFLLEQYINLDHVLCRQTGTGHISFQQCLVIQDWLRVVVSVCPFIIVFWYEPNWSQLRRTPVSFRPSRRTTINFSKKHIVSLFQTGIDGHDILSVKSSSCAAVVNICGGSWAGPPCGRSFMERFSMLVSRWLVVSNQSKIHDIS